MRPHAKVHDNASPGRRPLARPSQRPEIGRRAVRRKTRPSLEGLEVRDLPSTILSQATPSTFLPNPAVIQQSIDLLYGPGSATPMTPTPREVKRETFTARWIGDYTIGPPTFTDRASTIHAWSKSGGSNQFLKGKFQMEIFPPANPNATPTPGNPFANRISGLAVLTPQNYLQSSSVVLLDLIGSPSSSPLPTHLSWTYDTSSGGAYVTPTGFTQGTGTLDIKWIPSAHPVPGSLGSGKLIVTFQGLINFNEIASPVSPVYS